MNGVELEKEAQTDSANEPSIETEFPTVMVIARCFILRRTEKGEEILLLHRTKDTKYNPGKWEMPGGKMLSWQDFERTTEREVLEETGLSIKIVSHRAFIDGRIVDHSVYTGMLYMEVVFPARLEGGIIRLSSDHTEHKWVTPEEAVAMDLSFEARQAIASYLLPIDSS